MLGGAEAPIMFIVLEFELMLMFMFMFIDTGERCRNEDIAQRGVQKTRGDRRGHWLGSAEARMFMYIHIGALGRRHKDITG